MFLSTPLSSQETSDENSSTEPRNQAGENASVSRRKFIRNVATTGALALAGLGLSESVLHNPQRVYAATGATVSIDSSDTNRDYLNSKIVTGTGLTKNVLSPGGNEQLQLLVSQNALSLPASKLVWRDAITTYVKDGVTGTVTTYTSSTRDTDAIQAAVNGLTSGRTWKEKVVLRGSFTINSPGIMLPDYIVVETQGQLFMASSANTAIFQNANRTSGTDIDLVGGTLDGNGSNQSSNGQAVLFSGTLPPLPNNPPQPITQWMSKIRIVDVTTRNCKSAAFDIRTCQDVYIAGCYVDCGSLPSSGGIGLSYGTRIARVINCEVYNSTNIGINCSGGATIGPGNYPVNSCHIIGCYVWAPSTTSLGISIDGLSYDCFVIGCKVDGNGSATQDAINLEGWSGIGGPHECGIIGCRVTGGGRISVTGPTSPLAFAQNNVVSDCIVDGASQHGFYIVNALNTQIANCISLRPRTGSGFAVLNSSWTRMSNCDAEFCPDNGFWISSSSGCQITNCNSKDNNQANNPVGGTSNGFSITDDYGNPWVNGLLLGNCNAIDDQGTKTQAYGVYVGANEAHVLILGGNMTGNHYGGCSPYPLSGTNHISMVMGADLIP